MEKGSFDSHLNIIKYWIDVELSAPPLIKITNTKKSDLKWNQIISFKHNDDITWLSPLVDKLENSSEWLHKIYLGIFNTDLVIKEFSDEIPDINELKYTHQTCLLSFVLDNNGIPIKGSITIPEYIASIAYAKSHNKNEYNPFEERMKDLFSTWSYTIQKNKKSADKNDLIEFLNLILSELKWDLLTEAYKNNEFGYLAYSESISTAKNRKFKFDSDITSSLLAEDLKRVEKFLNNYDSSSALKYYLSKDYNDIEYKDVVRNKKYLKETLNPSGMPDVCWPSESNKKLVTSQQFAVNKIFNELEHQGLFSVNGPPGTGKTTLLRDVIANIIYSRAKELYKFRKNPDDAMGEIGKITYKFSGKGEKKIYGLHNKLSGFEIVVASSNNGAVENITKELPVIEEVDASYLEDIKYFEEISNNVNQKKSWGLISATLGNKQNNYNFTSNFLFQNTDDEGNQTRSIFDFLKDSRYFDEKTMNWEAACVNFKEKQDAVKRKKQELEIVESAINNSQSYLDMYNKLKDDFQKKHTYLKETEKNLVLLVAEAKKLKEKIEYLSSDKKSLFRPKKDEDTKQESLNNFKLELRNKAMKIGQLKNDREIFIDELKILKVSIDKQAGILNKIKKIRNEYKERDIKGIPGNSFWDKNDDYIQQYSPFITNDLNNARKELFIASLALHKAFIVQNNEKISSNLRLFKEILDGEFFENDKYYQAIWETFFLIVPVVSTTFSSLGNLFSNMKENSIGWLLVDESGQATPQAPVGGLWRAKRAVFVGDPLQIEPVITVEKKLSDVLLKKNNIGFNWNSYNFSAQRIADRNNKWGTVFGNGSHSIWVGAPLRVHRRCDEPMFSISNKIAYDNTMIFGKSQKNAQNEVNAILGESKWFNIKGESSKDSHWIQEEGDKLIELLTKIKFTYPNKLPNVYIISPFKSVIYEVQRLLARRKNEWACDNVSDNDIAYWINNSVGTIHSFQGKEVDIVFLILGGNISKAGAINWVCEEPNILNVAVTRSKNLFYIIGNSNIWNKGVFGLVKQYIKTDKKIENDT